MEKLCTKCGQHKPLSEMRKERNNKSGYGSTCLPCFRTRDAERRVARLASKLWVRCDKGLRKRIGDGTHVCLLSDRNRHAPVAHMLDDFGFVRPEFKGTYEGKLRLTDAERRERRLEAEAAKAAAQREGRSRWLSDNDIDFPADVYKAIYHRVRTRIRTYRRKYGINVQKSFIGLYGRTIDEYFIDNFGYSTTDIRLHISKQFAPGMSWLKFLNGEIHVDHKSPMAMFDIGDPVQLRNCYQLANLQPLWAAENMTKSSWCDITDTKIAVR